MERVIIYTCELEMKKKKIYFIQIKKAITFLDFCVKILKNTKRNGRNILKLNI